MGITNNSEVTVDTAGIVLILVGGLILVIELWEVRLLINFFQAEIRNKIFIDNGVLRIKKRGRESILKFTDIKSIDFYQPVFGSRSLTKHLNYSILKFKNSETIIITSFTKNTFDVEKMFSGIGIRKSWRDRKFFELIPLD
jgi:cell division protein FtsX